MSLGRRFVSTGAADAVCLTESVQAFGADSTYSSNKLLYQFENDVTNDVGTPSATNSGATFSSTAKFGSYSADFAGTTQHIDTEYNTDDTALTHSFWMYQHSITGSYNAILGTYWNGGGSGLYGYYLWSSDGTTLNWTVHTSNAAYVQVSGTVSLNAWHHVVLTWSDGVGASIYIDGSLAEFTASSLARQKNDETITLGNLDTRGTSTVGYDGLLDQYRYYNKSITAQDVATLYAETDSTTSNTNLFNEGAGVALYSLDYDASDASGYYDGTPTDVDFGVGGQINTGARFNGTDSFIQTSLSLDSNNASISFWAKADTVGSTRPIYMINNRNGILVSYAYTSSSNSLTSNTTNQNTLINSTTWTSQYNHIVVNMTGFASSYTLGDFGSAVNVEVFLNRNSIGTTTQKPYGLSDGCRIGRSNGTLYFDGSIDQVRIFSKALNQTEVDALYAETACVHTATTTDNDYPTTNVAYYKFDNSAEDEKGSYDGTQVGDVEYRFGKYGQAAVFNGSNSYITVPNLAGFTNYNFTMSFWFNSTSTAAQYFIDFRNPIYMEFGYDIGSGAYNNTYSFVLYTGTQYAIHSSADLRDGNWHHIAVTYDGATLKMYIDNATPITSTINDNTQYAGTGNVIGGAVGGSAIMDGKIDQLRIFTSELSSSQVAQLYNEKPETDTSTFKTVLYEGNNSTQYISNVGFQPDLVWVKVRDANGYNHNLFDTIRGATYRLFSNLPNPQDSNGKLTSFDANGFFLSSGGDANPSKSMVAWCWKGSNTDAATNVVGDIESQVSNSDKGFSIVKWSGSAANETVGHGLTVDGTATTPELILVKRTNGSNISWLVSNGTIMGYLNDTDSFTSTRNDYYISSFSTTTIGVKNYAGINASGDLLIMYCFASVSGVSKIGSYEGTNSTVTVSDVGFKPSFVMIKNVDDSANWVMLDNRRNTIEDRLNNWLRADTDDQETGAVSTAYITVNDNGFIVANTTSLGTNADGDTYLYMAFK